MLMDVACTWVKGQDRQVCEPSQNGLDLIGLMAPTWVQPDQNFASAELQIRTLPPPLPLLSRLYDPPAMDVSIVCTSNIHNSV